MKLNWRIGVVTISLGLVAGCASQDPPRDLNIVRGDENQVYVDRGVSLDGSRMTDGQMIDIANKHCAKFERTAVFKGQLSTMTLIFACVKGDS